MRAALTAALLAALAAGAPERRINYAESRNRLVCAFVFGSRDTCRVIRRYASPVMPADAFLRRPPGADYRGEKGDAVIAEFNLPRRPVHIVPADDGRCLLAFANRSPDGSRPADDSVLLLDEEGRRERIEYEAIPEEALPEWPRVARELPHEPPKPAPPRPFDYAFLVEEVTAGRFLVARQSEGAEGLVHEIVCFAIETPAGKVSLPEPSECDSLLGHREEAFVAGAAYALALRGDRKAAASVRGALARVGGAGARARIAQALAMLGDETGRRTLRGLLREAPEAAALALLRLPPEKGDGETLANALAEADAEKARLLGLCLARLGPAALPALQRLLQSSKPQIRASAAPVLGALDDPESEARLLRLGRDGEEAPQSEAAIALTRPPRALHPQNHEALGQAIDACRRGGNRKALLRLVLLAAQAEIRHDAVLKALVDAASDEPKAIWALQRLAGKELRTADDWRAWWKSR